eukprot:SM007016S21277  [mRNA]  locus=s7016:109:696:+ [translate_table: standard]
MAAVSPLRRAPRSASAVATPVRPSPETPAVEEREDESQAPEAAGGFRWMDHWYPVSLVEDLDPAVPTPFKLLGRDLVLWRDASGSWRAFRDLCPHRLAPLSRFPPVRLEQRDEGDKTGHVPSSRTCRLQLSCRGTCCHKQLSPEFGIVRLRALRCQKS